MQISGSRQLVLRAAIVSSVDRSASAGLTAFKPPTDFCRHVLVAQDLEKGCDGAVAADCIDAGYRTGGQKGIQHE